MKKGQKKRRSVILRRVLALLLAIVAPSASETNLNGAITVPLSLIVTAELIVNVCPATSTSVEFNVYLISTSSYKNRKNSDERHRFCCTPRKSFG